MALLIKPGAIKPHPLSLLALCAITLSPTVASTVGHAAPLPDVLTQSIAYYATLSSYADTGRMKQEVPGIIDDAKFTTYFRRQTRDLYFDYQALTSMNPADGRTTIDMSMYRTVIWMFKGNMETYDHQTRTRAIVPPANGGQTSALRSAAHGSDGASILIPSLLYSQAGLGGTIREIYDATLAGSENVNGRACHKVVGMTGIDLPSGKRANDRPVTVWIDAESKLIRRVFEDTPKGYPSSSYLRLTINLEPQVNPALEDSRFQFTPPAR